jgi:DNA processing protein
MATGIDDIYPWQHRELAERMVETPGCALVTDYPTKTSPVALNFIRRNRIIAGLSSSTIVIESAEKGGSLITARYANDYSKDVYALPGRVDDRKSAGCNSLIRKQMAEIIDSLEDLPERLGLSKTSKKAREDVLQNAERFYRGSLPSDKVGAILEILEEVKRSPGIDYDGLSSALSLPFGVVAECAGLLENDGFISTDLIKRCTINGKIV